MPLPYSLETVGSSPKSASAPQTRAGARGARQNTFDRWNAQINGSLTYFPGLGQRPKVLFHGPLDHHQSPVHVQGLAGHVGGLRRGEIDRGRGYVLGGAEFLGGNVL